jgi:hypothetical protein
MAKCFARTLSMSAMAAVGALVAGCSAPADTAANANNATVENAAPAAGSSTAASNAAPPALRDEGTIGGDGSDIALAALSPADVDGAKLTGELGCSFSNTSGDALLVAMGDVASAEPARGIVKVADYVEPVSAAGGFDAMVKGVTFAGKGKTIAIALTGKPKGSGESPPVAGTLTYDRADGARRTFVGEWTCGP